MPSGDFNIPTASITIDGVFSDWGSIEPVFRDPPGDEDPDLSGMDIEKFYMAQDNDFYYFRVTTYDGPSTGADGGPMYCFMPANGPDWVPGQRVSCVYPLASGAPSEPQVVVVETTWDPSTMTVVNSYDGAGHAAGSGGSVEWKTPKGDMLAVAGKYVSAWASMWNAPPPTGWPQLCDLGATRIQIETASISGVITCTTCASNNYSVLAFDGPDPDTSNLIGSAIVYPDGTYTIDGIPIGADVYLFAVWDSDGNGIIAAGDYWGSSVPYVVPENGISEASFGITNEIAGTSISGEITCNDFQPGLGQIYISALSGSDQNTDGVVATVSISEPGPYNIENLNVGDDVWVSAYWDANGTGASGPGFGDYTGSYVGNPIILSSEVNTGIDLGVGNPFAGAFGSVSPDPAYSCLFDFDGDGDVDGSDLAEMAAGLE